MNTDHQPQQPPTPDDWTDTVEPKRAEAFVEYLSRDIGYNLRHYASTHASHRMGEGCQCRPSRIPHVGLAAPESARPATLTVEQPVKAPVEGENSQRPSEPVLPRRIEPEDVRVGMVVECRDLVRVTAVHSGIIEADRWSEYRHPRGQEFRADAESETCERQWWLVEDAPAPVDPDAEALDQMAQAMANLDGSDDADEWVPWAEVALDALRETHDVTPRAEQ